MYVIAGSDAKRLSMDEKFVGWGGEVRMEARGVQAYSIRCVWNADFLLVHWPL